MMRAPEIASTAQVGVRVVILGVAVVAVSSGVAPNWVLVQVVPQVQPSYTIGYLSQVLEPAAVERGAVLSPFPVIDKEI